MVHLGMVRLEVEAGEGVKTQVGISPPDPAMLRPHDATLRLWETLKASTGQIFQNDHRKSIIFLNLPEPLLNLRSSFLPKLSKGMYTPHSYAKHQPKLTRHGPGVLHGAVLGCFLFL
jgi:hypothetical protein